jgi:iron only hydrogenase large subunit-like protein
MINTIQDHGLTLLKFGRANGFRNIQNIVRKLKQKSKSEQASYDFIEIMACPGGCTNGGGQIGGGLEKADSKKNTQQVNQLYDSVHPVSPGWHPKLKGLYDQLIADPTKRTEVLHTTYHAVPKLDTNPLAIKW